LNLRFTFQTAVRGLKTHGSRSALTILGIVIGITAIILIMAIGNGAQNLILSQIEGMGSKTIIVIPGREPKGPTDPSVVQNLLSDSLKENDLISLQNPSNVPGLGKIMPIVFGPGVATFEDQTYRPTIIGTSDQISEIFDLQTDQGNFFTDDDVKGRSDVVVLGSKAKDELFGDSPAVGEKIKLKEKTFRVIGVCPRRDKLPFSISTKWP